MFKTDLTILLYLTLWLVFLGSKGEKKMAADRLFAEDNPSVYPLGISSHFEALSENEKLYAHWMSRAAFEGTRIILRQNSAEGEGIFDLIVDLHRQCDGDWESLAKSSGITREELRQFFDYASMFLANLGNYAAFNKRKFFPRIPRSSLASLASCSPSTKLLFEAVGDMLYSGTHPSLGYPDIQNEVFSNYYLNSAVLSREDVSQIQKLMESRSLDGDNTRLKKQVASDGAVTYTILVASEVSHTDEPQPISPGEAGDSLQISAIQVVKGDHEQNMRRICECLEKAKAFAANPLQLQMLEAHQSGFRTGSMASQKEAQTLWVKDQSPKVECLVGFIEYYRDPHGVRAEWRGFVLIENQPQTKLFANLTQNSRHIIDSLPWNQNGQRDFDRETFEVPSFNSMEALTFVSTSIPAGTNVPGHADIREQHGYKNFAIRNRVIDSPPGKVSFLTDEDSILYSQLSSESFGVLVALHELFGHGSGKMLRETAPGQYNFNFDDPPYNPLSNEPIKTWYKPGEDFRPIFGWSYEECRCELVGLYLALQPDTAQLFPKSETGRSWEEVVYVMFLYVMRQGLIGLLACKPGTKNWGSSHARARFAITNLLMREGIGHIKYADEAQTDVEITLDRDDFEARAKTVISGLLLRMHIYLCTADKAGTVLYDELSLVSDEVAQYRGIVERLAGGHKQLVQANTVIEGGTVKVKEYDPTPEGMIRSWAERNI